MINWVYQSSMFQMNRCFMMELNVLFEREQKAIKKVYIKNMKQKVDMHFDEIADSLTKNNQGGYNEAFLSFLM